MNCSSPFRRVIERACSENGERNSGNYRSLELVAYESAIRAQGKSVANPQLKRWLRSFPTLRLRPKHWAGDLQGCANPVPFWLLQGELGSGKTQFTKGLVAGMGSNAAVSSPTFTIVHEYRDGPLPVYHFDFFRVENRKSLARQAWKIYFFGDGVSVIEWADRFPEFIPEQARWILFEIKSECQRIITVSPYGHENSCA